ncbi:MAG TPA: protein-L-isoaspartate(D-aspartate) O-methyltransferase [Polyangiaceae bacterium]|nr:protein-L-isoaspartate(D-aspartate) O-methyltransferase [Polyangiaceae bacterium]
MEQSLEPYLEAGPPALARQVSRVVSDARVIAAFATIPRHLFVGAEEQWRAYEDRALPLFEGQTISQPSMIALMLEALAPEPGNRALEVGAGSGYAAALLSTLVGVVDAVEIKPALVAFARQALARASVKNVVLHEADGLGGLPELAPFDRILVSAAARELPPSLVDQLAPGGRIAIPVGGAEGQTLRVGVRHEDGVRWEEQTPCTFVPLVGS